MSNEFDRARALSEAHINPDLYSLYCQLKTTVIKNQDLGIPLSDQERKALERLTTHFPKLSEVYAQEFPGLSSVLAQGVISQTE